MPLPFRADPAKSLFLGVVLGAAFASSALAQTTIATQYGDVAAPANPQHVIALSEDALDAAVALGVVPVGALARRGGSNDVAPYLADKVPGIQVVGTLNEPNVEAMVGLSPDLILAGTGLAQAQYDTFTQLAPTIVPPALASTADWRTTFALRAAALGKTAEGDAVLAQVEARIAEVKAQAENAGIAGQTVAVIRWQEAGPVVFTWKSMSGETLQSVGFTSVPFAQTIEGPHTDVLSLENLTEVDADWLVIAAFGATGKTAYDAVTTDPLYQNLKAVKEGHVIVTDGNLWSSTNGPLAKLAQLDDVSQAIAALQ